MPAPTLVAGAPCWIDLYSSDTAAATAFYGRLFGWKPEPPDERFGGYFTFTKDGKQVAGCMANDGQGDVPDTWTVYLRADDAQVTADAAASHGGRVEIPPMQVAEHGTMAIVTDPGQGRIGVWQPDTMQGLEVRDEVGTPVWFELHTRAYDESVGFYRDVFGWDTHVASDTSELRYTTQGEGENGLAGIMDAGAFLPEGAPATWSIYFLVEDADAALARIDELGGSIVRPAEDTPYGRLATAADPTGVQFRLLARN